MRDLIDIQKSEAVLEQLRHGGIFFTVAENGRPNTMTIGWGGFTIFWGKPVFIAPIRPSRFSREIVDRTGCFNLSVPQDGVMTKELAYCGSHSGRDGDKFEALQLATQPGQVNDIPILADCTFHYECKVLLRQPADMSPLPAEIKDRFYADGDDHILYFGEILKAYAL